MKTHRGGDDSTTWELSPSELANPQRCSHVARHAVPGDLIYCPVAPGPVADAGKRPPNEDSTPDRGQRLDDPARLDQLRFATSKRGMVVVVLGGFYARLAVRR